MKTLTVAELIELLQDQDPDAKVIFSTCYGDYSRTMQALPITGNTEQVIIEKSAYSTSGFAVADGQDVDDMDGDEYDNADKFLVIR